MDAGSRRHYFLMKKVTFEYADWFHPFLYPYKYKSCAGGRGSGKSQAFARFAVHRLAQHFSDPKNLETEIQLSNGMKTHLPYYPPGRIKILSARQFGISIKNSVKQVLENYIYDSGLSDEFSITRYEIRHIPSGSECIFVGIDRNTDNIRSYEGIDVWWFEEAQFLTLEHMKVIDPTIRHERICPYTGRVFAPERWFSWNPINRSDYPWQRFVETPEKDDLHAHVNYYSNPWMPDSLLDQAKRSERVDPLEYDHVWLGQPDDGNADSQILPYSLLQPCIEAWDKRPTLMPNMRTDLGLDVATGGKDLCCVAVRTGPVVHDIKSWRGGTDLNLTARITVEIFKDICKRENIKTPHRMFYDGSHQMEGGFKSLGKRYAPYEAVLFGGKIAGEKEFWDGDTRNSECFDKRNIQMAMALRLRAIRTARLLEGKEKVDPNACLFINPKIKDIKRIMGMLTQPIRRVNTSGKWEIDKRGGDENAKSPDEFDALCLAFSHDSMYGLRAKL